MEVQLWQALIPLVLGGVIAALPKILTARADNRRTDAATLAEAYGHVIDRLEKQVDGHAGEIKALRDQATSLMELVNTRDRELGALRAENLKLRTLVEELQRQVSRMPRRHDDPPTLQPDHSDAT